MLAPDTMILSHVSLVILRFWNFLHIFVVDAHEKAPAFYAEAHIISSEMKIISLSIHPLFKQSAGSFHHVFHSEAEVLEELSGRAGGTEAVHANKSPVKTYVLVPGGGATGLNSYAGTYGRRQHAVAIFLTLSVKHGGARHGYHTYFLTLLFKLLCRVHA